MLPRGELDVDVTSALPQIHLLRPGPFRHPRTKVLVRHEQNVSVRRRRPHDFIGVATRANHVGKRFHARAAIDVSDDVIIFVGVLFQKLRELFRRTRFRERTAGVEIGKNHALARIDDLGRFRHEMDAAKTESRRRRFSSA